MKTFGDLKNRMQGGDFHAREIFENGYGISVVRRPGSYGYEVGLFEIAVLYRGTICYDAIHLTKGIIGNLTKDEVSFYMEQIQQLKY